MSWPNILALAVFVCVCGFIAYAGDLLGRRMGKRRLSLFGLRPRYTAIVTTTITGMLIATFTIAAVSIANREVGQLVLHGARILKEQKAEVDRYARELRQQQREVREARQQASEAGRERDRLDQDVKKLTSQISKVIDDLRRNETALARAEKERRLLTAEKDRLARDIVALKADMNVNQQALAKAEAELESTRTGLLAAEKEIADRQTEIADLAALKDKLTHDLLTTWGTPVTFRSGEEITREIVDCAQSEPDIRREVLALLSKADEIARAEGAGVGDNGRAVKIITKEIYGGATNRKVILDENESLDLIVNSISAGSGNVVARVFSVGNSYEGEQASVEIQLNYNRLIYTAGEEVASTLVDGRLSRGQILESLISFLRMDVRFAAIYKNVIPMFDDDGQPSVGAVEWDQVFDLVDQVKASGKPVLVRAVAKSDTWSVGPLDVNLVASTSP